MDGGSGNDKISSGGGEDDGDGGEGNDTINVRASQCDCWLHAVPA